MVDRAYYVRVSVPRNSLSRFMRRALSFSVSFFRRVRGCDALGYSELYGSMCMPIGGDKIVFAFQKYLINEDQIKKK